jgi:hypothetical protein
MVVLAAFDRLGEGVPCGTGDVEPAPADPGDEDSTVLVLPDVHVYVW